MIWFSKLKKFEQFSFSSHLLRLSNFSFYIYSIITELLMSLVLENHRIWVRLGISPLVVITDTELPWVDKSHRCFSLMVISWLLSRLVVVTPCLTCAGVGDLTGWRESKRSHWIRSQCSVSKVPTFILFSAHQLKLA